MLRVATGFYGLLCKNINNLTPKPVTCNKYPIHTHIYGGGYIDSQGYSATVLHVINNILYIYDIIIYIPIETRSKTRHKTPLHITQVLKGEKTHDTSQQK